MTDTTTPSLATHVPMWRRRLLATALIIGAGMAVGVGTTALTSDGVRRGDLSAGDTKDHPNYGPIDTATTTTWTGDTKDHPNYGPIDTATTTTWTGDAKDHPNYGPVDTAAGTGDAKDHPNYGPAAPASLFPCIDEDSLRPLTLVTAQATGVVANVTSPGPGPGRS
jgi:hypothetical protein